MLAFYLAIAFEEELNLTIKTIALGLRFFALRVAQRTALEVGSIKLDLVGASSLTNGGFIDALDY